MKFYYIDKLESPRVTANEPSTVLLRRACEAEHIDFIEIISNDFDFANPPRLSKDDLIFRASTDSLSRQLEKLLLTMHPTSFYTGDQGFSRKSSIAVHLAHGIPINHTIFGVSDNQEMLKSSVEKLGGFPIIIKVLGGSHGVGVIRVDSFPSLLSITDYLKATTDGEFVLRQYLEHTSHARLIVLGDTVIDSIKYTSSENDFRTNAGGDPTVQVMNFGEEINNIAVRAVNVLGLEFGGVDVIIDKSGNPYVLEVNFPCYFPRAQRISGANIAHKMVTYLKAKANAA